ncbi:hypothetical protein MNBD_ALPHA09-706 [hydrothermal vent metagenome]|uniref:Flagellar protein FlgN n=1 Tax=hydrothermal vent metagenome TaxID=652676 RepID=A0A3B0TA78_9ZZZZ
MKATPQTLVPETSTKQAPEMAGADNAATARALCRSLGATARALMEVIDNETAVLREGRPQAIEALQADKIELSARYLGEMARLKRYAETIAELGGNDVETLKALTQELGAKLLENRDALADVLSVSERLIRTATMSAIAARSGPSTYGCDGLVSQPPAQATAAISVNRAL